MNHVMTSSCTSSSSWLCSVCCLDSGVWWKRHVSSPVTMESRNLSPSCAQRLRNLSAEPLIWRDFGSALPFKKCLTKKKLVQPLSDERGLKVKDQGRRQCCHNRHENFPYRPTRNVSLLSGHASYIHENIARVVAVHTLDLRHASI